jgi:hypothetical protein
MLNLDLSEMHLLVLICTNPQHPRTLDLIANRLKTPAAKAVAITVLKSVLPPEAQHQLPPIPSGVDEVEVNAAAAEFAELAQIRRQERAVKRKRYRDAVPA